MDIQPVLNHYKAVMYMCAYLSKSEDECSQARHHAIRQAFEERLDKYEQMRAIAHAYTTKRECSIQEAVYNTMPELWLRKIFPAVIFANSNLPEERYRMCLSEDEIKELPEDSTEIFKRNHVDRYVERPNRAFAHGKYGVLDDFCFAEFLRNYYVAPKPIDNDNQPEELKDEVIERNHSPSPYPKVITLMFSGQKLKCRSTEAVLRYHVPNKNKHFEKYAHHVLFMFYPFRDESELKSGEPPSYVNKLNEPGVLEVICSNQQRIEPYADLVDLAFTQFRDDCATNLDPYGQQENDNVNDELLNDRETSDNENSESENSINDPTIRRATDNLPAVLSDDIINEKIRSLNVKQREIFEKVYKWARDYAKNRSCKFPREIFPFYIFLSGGGGCGKSHLVNTIYHSVTKLLLHRGGNPEKPRILLLAPTKTQLLKSRKMCK